MTNKEKLISDEIASKHNLVKYMTLEEVMKYSGCSKRHVNEEIKRKNLRAFKPVRALLFTPEDVATWFKRKVRIG